MKFNRIQALLLLPLSPIVIIIAYVCSPIESDTFGDIVEETFRVWNREYWK